MLRAIRNIDYSILLCQDMESMRHFYQDVLGFPLSSDGDEWIDFRVGASRLSLRTRGRRYDGAPPEEGTVSVQLAFRVAPAQVESCFTELQQKGAIIIEPPTDQPWGHRTLFFKDPEGYLLEIYAEL